MDNPKIMYICAYCFENAPEGCCHDREQLRVPSDGFYICASCHDDGGIYPEGAYDDWEALPKPPIYMPAQA